MRENVVCEMASIMSRPQCVKYASEGKYSYDFRGVWIDSPAMDLPIRQLYGLSNMCEVVLHYGRLPQIPNKIWQILKRLGLLNVSQEQKESEKVRVTEC